MMNEQEAIKLLKSFKEDNNFGGSIPEFLELAIQSLEMQDKLKQWIEGYKRQEFADMTLTRDGLIDILNEFRLECGE